MSLAARLGGRSASFARRHGAPATLRVKTGETVVDRTKTPTYADHSVRVLVGRRLLDLQDGILAKTEHLRVSLPAEQLAAGVAPAQDSVLVLAGRTYRVLDVDAGSPGATVIAYELELGQ